MVEVNGEITAVISLSADSKKLEKVIEQLVEMPETQDVYEVTGEYDLIAVVKAKDISDFRVIVKDKILQIDGVVNSVSSFVLYTHKKAGEKRC
ncbi:MAG: Lrp/AsnC ligand binding domain-containing protein [Candidatus Bathyarchaeia archaeon]